MVSSLDDNGRPAAGYSSTICDTVQSCFGSVDCTAYLKSFLAGHVVSYGSRRGAAWGENAGLSDIATGLRAACSAGAVHCQADMGVAYLRRVLSGTSDAVETDEHGKSSREG